MDYEDHVFKEVKNATAPIPETDVDITQDYLDVLLTIVGLLGIMIEIFLIYIICYYRKLHTPINIYLINWSIANIGAMIMTISCFPIYSTFKNLSLVVVCFYLSIPFALYFNVIFFMIMLTMDWWFSAFWPSPLQKFREYTKYIIATIWVLSAMYFVTSAGLCSLSAYYLIFHYTLPILFTILMLLVVGLHVVRIIKKRKTGFEYYSVNLLYIPTGFVCCWFLNWINIFVQYYSYAYYTLSDLILFLHPILNFILLVIYDSDFKACFFKVIEGFPCFCFKYHRSNEHFNNVNVAAANPSAPIENGDRYL
ncbi:hypothetical protein RI129_006677 [Pyrocoelia pectoralis]|uniref:G-protein coupled receptors family 1 profile domain-containing protein n=1 Tax=Pyrocoelia pectoralis TaxID=417401 RepID=A0AAN7ZIP6_9COLE